MTKIKNIKARMILDSRGIPTIETSVKTADGISTASVPSGKSTGINEAIEFRDGGKKFHGKGVLKAIKKINTEIAHKLKQKHTEHVDEILLEIDNTQKKSILGANTMLSVSMACFRASALAQRIPLYKYISLVYQTKRIKMPVPSFNVINGGKHAGNSLEIQEYMIMPVGAKNFAQAMQIGSETYTELKEILTQEYGKNAVNIGDEGGFAPMLGSYKTPLDLIMDAVHNLGYQKKVKIALDIAATSFYRNGKYYLEGQELDTEELIGKYSELCKEYPIISIEDPFQENDFKSFSKLNKKLRKIQIVGDDLLCTNTARIQKAIITDACNCLLLKMNQIGTLSESLDAARISMKQKWNVMVSHRSGETNDSFIADLAVGIGCGQIKAGATCRGERLAKYNRLLKIEEETKTKYGLK